jgi:hypothetical protein
VFGGYYVLARPFLIHRTRLDGDRGRGAPRRSGRGCSSQVGVERLSGASVCGQRDLVRPVAVNRVLAELASAIDHASPMRFVAARAHADARARGGNVGGAAGGVSDVAQREQKGNKIVCWLSVHVGDNILMRIAECTPGLASHAPLARVLERLPST